MLFIWILISTALNFYQPNLLFFLICSAYELKGFRLTIVLQKKRSLPACELPFAQTQLQAVLSCAGGLVFLGVASEFVALHSVEAPGSLARLHSQTALLCVDREHRKLRLAQRTCNISHHVIYKLLLKIHTNNNLWSYQLIMDVIVSLFCFN